MENVKDHDPWFGFEQEYFVTDNDGMPFGWNSDGTYDEQGIVKTLNNRNNGTYHAMVCIS